MLSRLRPHAPLAVALLALFFAIGGPSFAADAVSNAARLITGKQIKDSSLTTKDVKNGSLLKADFKGGQLPRGPQGQKGDPGAQGLKGDKGSVDPGQFVLATGLYEVTVGPGGWDSLNPNLKRSNVFGNWVSSSTDDGASLLLDAALPGTIAGKAMRLRAVTPCWNATGSVTITDVVISTWRETATAGTTDVVEQADPNDHTEAICKRYEFATPVDMSDRRRVSVRLSTGWSISGATIHVGGVTFELDRAP